MTYDQKITLHFWLTILWIVIAVLVAVFLVKPRETAGEENRKYNQFYDTALAQWQAPEMYEVTQYVLKGVMASGKEVYDGAIACPRNIELGTKVEIGGIEYVCEDRTHFKNDGTFDIWQQDYDVAIEWGRRVKIVNLISY